MNVIRTEIPDVLILEPKVFGDERGFFLESYNKRTFREATGLDVEFVQDNHSNSKRGVLRGLHYQIRQPQGKIVRVIAGEVFDVAVDLRRSSPSFGPARIRARLPRPVRPCRVRLQNDRLLRTAARAHAAVERPGARDPLAAGGVTTWCGFARSISQERKVAVTVSPISATDYAAPARRPRNSLLDSSALAKSLGIRLPSWEAGMRDVLSSVE